MLKCAEIRSRNLPKTVFTKWQGSQINKLGDMAGTCQLKAATGIKHGQSTRSRAAAATFNFVPLGLEILAAAASAATQAFLMDSDSDNLDLAPLLGLLNQSIKH